MLLRHWLQQRYFCLAVNKQLSILESWEKLTTNTRQEYKGKKLNEDEVADIVRDERRK